MAGYGVKEFSCKNKSKCNRKNKCALCLKFGKCKECEHSGACNLEKRSSGHGAPACYTTLY